MASGRQRCFACLWLLLCPLILCLCARVAEAEDMPYATATPGPPAEQSPAASVPATPAPAANQPAPAGASATAENEDLVLQLVINDTEMEDVVEATQRGGRLFLPLASLGGILDFPIKVDKTAHTASGWFIREQNTFRLAGASAEVSGKTYPVPAGAVLAQNDDLYVDSALLQQWWPMTFVFDPHRMTLNITTRETLPFEEKKLREKKEAALAGKQQAAPLTLKSLDTPYAAAQFPTLDLTANPSYDSLAHNLQPSYSVLATGDFGYLTTRLYAAGDLGHGDLTDLRMSAGRDDYQGHLLGPLNATSFRFGDVDSATLTQVATPLLGRGVVLSNRALDRPDNFDVTNFIGDTHPNWQAELYRNGTLIAFQTVGADGRYNFSNIPILFGNNVFRIALYGPEGQVEEVTKIINAAASLLEKGQFTYNISANQENKTLSGIGAGQSSLGTGLAGVGEFEYGLTKWATAAAGTAHTDLPDGGHNYATTGLRAAVGGVTGSLDEAYDASHGANSARASVSTDIKDTLLSLQEQISHDFETEEDLVDLTDLVDRETVARADRQINIGPISQLNSELSYTVKDHASGRDETIWTNQESKVVFKDITVTNTLTDDRDNRGLDNFTGTTFLRGYYSKTLLGGEVDYTMHPKFEPNLFRLTALYPISPKLSSNLTLTSQITGSRSESVQDTLTWDMEHYKISFTARASDMHDLFAGITLNMSIGRVPNTGKWFFSGKPLADTGTVAVSPYLDANYNQQRDAGEETPPNTAMKIGAQTVKVDADGTALAGQLPINQPLKIMLDPADQQANPFWSTGVDGYTVVPRPGKIIAVNFPIFETSQIDGTVSPPPGEKAAGLLVELVNADGQVVRSTHAAFDGYYLLGNIMPGSYRIRIAEDSLREHGFAQPEQPALTVSTSDFFVKDIKLIAAAAGPQVPGSVPPSVTAAAIPAIPTMSAIPALPAMSAIPTMAAMSAIPTMPATPAVSAIPAMPAVSPPPVAAENLGQGAPAQNAGFIGPPAPPSVAAAASPAPATPTVAAVPSAPVAASAPAAAVPPPGGPQAPATPAQGTPHPSPSPAIVWDATAGAPPSAAAPPAPAAATATPAPVVSAPVVSAPVPAPATAVAATPATTLAPPAAIARPSLVTVNDASPGVPPAAIARPSLVIVKDAAGAPAQTPP